MPGIISRAAWGARPPDYRTHVPDSRRSEFIVHYTQGPASQTPRAIQDFHMDGNDWSDVGYNFLVDADGNIYEGRGWDVRGAHARGHNTTGIGVAFIGYDGDATPQAKAAIRWLYEQAQRRFGPLQAKGHRDVNATSCPGDELYAWVHEGMPAGGYTRTGDSDMLGLKIGDQGEAVELVQLKVKRAGFGDALGKAGVDGVYGANTAEGVRLCRESVGSRALPGYGDRMTSHAVDQVDAAVMRAEASTPPGGSSSGPVEIPQDLTVRSLTADRLNVGG